MVPSQQSELQVMYDANELSSTSQVPRDGTEEWTPLNLVVRVKGGSPSASALAPTMQRVTVADIDMKFTSMVWFMVKWAFAAPVRLKAKMQKSPENKSVHFPRCRFVRFEVHLLQTPASERQWTAFNPQPK